MSLDIENFPALLAYLRQTGRITPDETPELRNLAGGVSNRVVLLQRANGQAWVLKQALAQLRVSVQWFSDPRRIEREALGMIRLFEIAPWGPITRLIFVDPTEHLLAMEAVPQPHENWKTMLLSGRLEMDHVTQFAMLLGDIHRDGRGLRAEFEDRSFFESLRLEPYYLYTAGRVPKAADFLNALVERTRKNRYTLVHGDYSPKNVLIHECENPNSPSISKLVLLDHEVIHFGDGGFDVGFALTHFLSKAHHLHALRAKFAVASLLFWDVYRDSVPANALIETVVVEHTLGCMLARCRGRSPLEYLTDTESTCQADAIVSMMDRPPTTVRNLITQFLNGIA